MELKINKTEKKMVAVYDNETNTLLFRTNDDGIWKNNKTAAFNSPYGRGKISVNGSHELEKAIKNSPTRVAIYEGDEITIKF